MSRFHSIPGLVEVELGQTVESPSINRVDVADGSRGRVIPLTSKWLAATVAFTDEPCKGSWFVDRSILLKYGLKGRIVYVCPVVRLNTDAKANVLDASYRIEYLRLSENVYTEFADKASEMANMHSITVSKTKKGEFSYVVPSPSNKVLSQQQINLINQVMQSVRQYDVEAVAALALSDVARPFDTYLELAKSKGIEVLPDEPPVSGSLPSSFGNAGLLPDNQAAQPAQAPQGGFVPNFNTAPGQMPSHAQAPAEEAQAEEFDPEDEFSEQ